MSGAGELKVPDPRPPAPAKAPGPIIPQRQSALRTLGIAMTVMCYLACLAVGGLVLVNRAVDAWMSDIAREVTVQVRPLEGADLETEVAAAEAILTAAAGIRDVRVLPREASAKLLEPWLGSGRMLDELPIPRLVTAVVDQNAPPDLAALEASLRAGVQGVSLDTHRRWQAELTRTAALLGWLGTSILLLIAGAAVALVIFATRGALEANRDIIEVIHLAGARDGFIAGQVQRRFLVTGARAGLVGAVGGLATFALVALAGRTGGPPALGEASGLMLPGGPSSATLWSYGLIFLVPMVATLISVATARISVMRMLRAMF